MMVILTLASVNNHVYKRTEANDNKWYKMDVRSPNIILYLDKLNKNEPSVIHLFVVKRLTFITAQRFNGVWPNFPI